MPKKKQPYNRFKPGDRVVKKSNMTVIGRSISTMERRLPKIVHGEVIEIFLMKNKRGAFHPYCKVKWDGQTRIDTAAANRLWFEEDKDKMIANQVESIGA
jgi:hypothetical protein